MKRIIIWLTVCCSFCFQLKAQHDFREGFIISPQNDTIHGFIDYKNSRQLSRLCIFKSSEDAKPEKYTPAELAGFRFTDEKYYVSREVEDNDGSRWLFLEYLVNGLVDVYYFRDSDGDHYLVEKDDNLYFLEETEREILRDGVTYLQKDKTYIGTLNFIMRDAPSIQKKLNQLQLNHNPLINIAKDYHYQVCETGEKCIVYQRKPLLNATTFGPLIGFNLNAIDVIDNDFAERYYYFVNSDFTHSKNISLGAFVNTKISKISDRLSLQLDATLNYRSFYTKNQMLEPIYNGSYTNDITLRQTTVKGSFYFKYEFPTGRLKPSYLVGAFLDYNFNPSFTRRQEIRYSWIETREIKEYKENSLSGIDWGIKGGVGLSYQMNKGKEIQVHLLYGRGFGILFPHFNSSGFSLNIGVPLFGGKTFG